VDVQLFRDAGLGNGSYLIEVSVGRAVLVDPDRRVRRYLDAAQDRGFEIVGVLDTHLHADFVSGAQDIRAETGADLYEPAEAGVPFPHRPMKPGERIDLEDVEVEVLSTPGHSSEHVSYVFRREGQAAPVLFSGGSLIVGGAARSDLAGPELTDHLTHHQYETLQRAFTDLPDETLVKPTHGGGSFCSAGSGKKHTSTLGEERETNKLLSMGEKEFLGSWPASFPRTPAYFARMREINWSGPRLAKDIDMPRPLTPEAFAAAAAEPGSVVVDVRDAASYAEAHGQGSLAIPFRDAFPTWLGWLVPADARLLLVLGDMALEDVVGACLLVGLERLEGYIDGGMEAWREAGLPVRSLPTIGPDDVVSWMEKGAQPLDVREPDELELGGIAGAVSVPLGDLPGRAAGLAAGRPLVVYCASGMRSTTAASLLERAGIGPVVNLRGGYGVWQEAGRD
jgi:hydroxyacylglutathione hydrolase